MLGCKKRKTGFRFLRDRSPVEGHAHLPWFPFSFPGWDWQQGDFPWADGNAARKEGPFWWCRADIGDTNGNPDRDGDASSAPVPLPAAVWLMGSGLIGLVGLRKWFGKR
jgi:hypothetical protein